LERENQKEPVITTTGRDRGPERKRIGYWETGYTDGITERGGRTYIGSRDGGGGGLKVAKAGFASLIESPGTTHPLGQRTTE